MANFFQFQANYGKPAESPYVSQPVEKMGEAILESSKVNSLGNQALADVLNLKVDSLNVHKDELQNIKNQYDSEVNSLADELSKNPNKTTFQKIAELRKKVKSDLDATGRLGKIQNAYNQYASWQKDLDEETKKYNESGGTKGIDADTRNKKIQMLQYNLGNWYNEKGLTDQEIPLPKIVGYVDVENLAYDLAQKLPKMSYDDYTKWAQSNDLNVASPETFERKKTRISTNLSRVGDKGEIIFDKNKLKDVVSNFLSNDPRVKTYLSDRADIDIFDSLSNDLLLNPDASKEIRNQYKQLYPQLREKIVNSKINDISDRSQKAFATKDKEFSTDRVENDSIKEKNKKNKLNRIIDENTPAVNFSAENQGLLSPKDLKKSPAITSNTTVGPTGAQIGTGKTYEGELQELTGEKLKQFNNIAKNINPQLQSKFEKGTINKEEKEKLYNDVSKYIENIQNENEKIGSIFTGLDENDSKDITIYIFKTDKLKETGSGNFINRYFYDPENNTLYNGKDFYENIVKDELSNNENGLIAITSESNGANPYVALTGENSFANAKQVSVNGKQYIMGDGNAEYITNEEGEKINITSVKKQINAIYNSRFTPLKKTEIRDSEGNTYGEYWYDPNSKTYKLKNKKEGIIKEYASDEAIDLHSTLLNDIINGR